MKKLLLLFLFPILCYGQGIPRKLSEGSVTLSSTQNNYVTTTDVLNINATADFTISGFEVRSGGRLLIVNQGTGSITVEHEGSGSNAANRVSFLSGVNYIIGPNEELGLRYSGSDSRWVLMSISIGSVSGGLSPPTTQVQNISISDYTSTSVTVTITRPGANEGDGVIVLMSEDIITQNPINNNTYTGGLNFGGGDNINSSGVYVMSFGTDVSLAITGLTAGTIYYITAYEYAQENNLVSYNTSTQGVFNTISITTLADAATPTEQFTITSKKSFENSIQVTGEDGNGDVHLVVASTVSKDSVHAPTDGVDYVVGESIGTAFVVYKGSDETFLIDGYTKDTKIFFKIFERENTDYLYNTQAVVDSAFTALIYDGGSGAFVEGSGDPAGKTLLESSAHLYYDIGRELTIANSSNITNGDAGLVDYSPNSYTATVVSTPTSDDLTFNSTSVKSVATTGTTALTTGTNGATWLANSSGFEIHASVEVSDGVVPSGATFIYGGQGNNGRFYFRFTNAGFLEIQYREAVQATITIWRSTSAVLVNGVNSVTIQARLDWVNDVWSAWANGVAVPGAYVSGTAIASIDPTTWNSSVNMAVGNFNNFGTYDQFGNGVTISTTQFAITTLLTTQEREDVYEYISYQASAGSEFTNYDVFEGNGFTYGTSDDSLRFSAGSALFEDYLTYITVIPDSLQELDVIVPFKIKSATTSNPSSIFIGLRNATTTEANYGVWGHLNLDNDAGSFGKLQMFSGDGAIGDAGLVFRGTSSGGFVPALDSTYEARIRRSIVGNDAFYDFSVMDLYDSVVYTLGWNEANRPSSAYYGTTMKAFIGYQGDTDVAIGELTVVRTGEAEVDTSPPPTPTTYDYYTDNVNGVDTNPCTVAAPCLTATVTLNTLAASGGSNKSWGLSSGVHTINSALILPANLGLMEGTGANNTFIVGTQNLDHVFWFPGAAQTASMIQGVSASAISTTNHLKGFSLVGGSYLNRKKAVGIYVKNRDDFVIEDVNIEYFNSAGIVIDGSDDTIITGCNFIDAGGSGGNQDPDTGYPTVNGSYSTGNITMTGLVDGFNVIDCTITATNFGGGYGIKAILVAPFVPTHNVHIDNVDFNLHPQSAGATGTNFAIEFHDGYGDATTSLLGDFEVENCTFTNCSISMGVHQNAVDSYSHRIHHNNWIMNDSRTVWCIEVDDSNLEVDHNYFQSINARMFAYARYHNARISNNHHYHNNIYEVGANPSGTHRYLQNGGGIMNDILIENETIIFQSATGSKWEFWTVSASSQSGTFPPTASDNVVIQDCVFYGDNPGNANFFAVGGGPGFTNSILRNCRSTHLNIQQSATGFTNTNPAPSTTGSADWFNFFGPRWDYTSAGYYYPKIGSALIGAGNGSDTIGAVQP